MIHATMPPFSHIRPILVIVKTSVPFWFYPPKIDEWEDERER